MTRDEAARLLHLPTDALESEVRGAYALRVKADHPDHGGTGALLAQLKSAKDIMMSQCAIAPCKLCRGVAYTRGRFGVQRCTACKGSGDQS